MKVKRILWGLSVVYGTLLTSYAAVDEKKFELDVNEEGVFVEFDRKEGEAQFIKLNGDMKFGPYSFLFAPREKHTGLMGFRNNIGANLHLKADVPGVFSKKQAKVDVKVKLDRKVLSLREAKMAVGSFTVGYSDSILEYAHENAELPIATDASVMQIKYEHRWDAVRLGYALESAKELRVGWFDRSFKKGGDKNKIVNELDDPKKSSFEFYNAIPALGVSLGVVKDQVDLGLQGLLRCTDYTNYTDRVAKVGKDYIHWSGGVNLGFQYKTAAKEEKFTMAGHGFYALGLGDYVGGLAAIQGDKERKEMCAAYYTIEQGVKKLVHMDAWGAGGTLTWPEVIPKLSVSLAGSFLKMMRDEVQDRQRPDEAFDRQLNLVVPKVAYKLSKHWSMELGYHIEKEFRVGEGEKAFKGRKPWEHKFAGSMKLKF